MMGKLDKKLVEKYNKSSPYYCSYPTLSEWSEKFSHRTLETALEDLISKKEDIYFYFHFPFCPNKCYFCFCNAETTKNRKDIKDFLNNISLEIEHFEKFFEERNYIPKVRDVQIGGGSPSYMNEEEFNFLIKNIKKIVNFPELDEFAMEIEPRTTSPDRMDYYKSIGINRISFGVQDFDSNVQKAVNRIQPRGILERFLGDKVRKDFNINFDLLYGLPLQTLDSFMRTIENVIELSPDRITLLKYAHTPWRAEHQKKLEKYVFPDNYEKMQIFSESINKLTGAGYVYLGINDFVKKNDKLNIAKEKGELCRIFNGLAAGKTKQIIGIGPSSWTSFLNYYAQNVYFKDYSETIKSRIFPILRGYTLETEDLIRRETINSIICNQKIDLKKIEKEHSIDAKIYFEHEIKSMTPFIEDNLIECSDSIIKITTLGRLFIPQITSLFDSYIKEKEYRMTGP